MAVTAVTLEPPDCILISPCKNLTEGLTFVPDPSLLQMEAIVKTRWSQQENQQWVSTDVSTVGFTGSNIEITLVFCAGLKGLTLVPESHPV